MRKKLPLRRRCWALNPGPPACKAGALPLSYIPLQIVGGRGLVRGHLMPRHVPDKHSPVVPWCPESLSRKQHSKPSCWAAGWHGASWHCLSAATAPGPGLHCQHCCPFAAGGFLSRRAPRAVPRLYALSHTGLLTLTPVTVSLHCCSSSLAVRLMLPRLRTPLSGHTEMGLKTHSDPGVGLLPIPLECLTVASPRTPLPGTPYGDQPAYLFSALC